MKQFEMLFLLSTNKFHHIKLNYDESLKTIDIN